MAGMIGVEISDYPSTTTLTYLLSSTQHEAIITPQPQLRRDAPNPQAGGANCAQADQSASQASQQAFQQASESIRQASQQASQQAQQASQSAANAIQQAQNSASQSIAAMSRSSSSIASSASSAMSSIQASASSAIARANGAMSSAQFSASLSQQEASRAISQAGATAAAANEQARESQVSAITATQASLAIVGSIIASTLLTTLIFFLVTRHRKRSKRNKRPSQDSVRQIYRSDPKSPGSDRSSSTTSYSQKKDQPRRQNSKLSEVSYPDISITLGRTDEARKPGSIPRVKETSVLWNPRNPPQAPTLRSWLKLQDSVSPFGPLKLPIDENAKGPLGGQLKSPLRSIERTPSPKLAMSPRRSPKIPTLEPVLPIESKEKSTANENPITASEDDRAESTLVGQATTNRESQTTIWTDEVPSTYHVTTPTKYQKTPRSTARAFEMDFPMPDKPVRSTAEWLIDQQETSQSPVLLRPSVLAWRGSGATSSPSTGLPQNPRIGFPVSLKSVKGEVQYVGGRSRTARSHLEVMGGDSLRVSAVGKAM